MSAMVVWRRAIRWLMLALACAALGASAVPSRAVAQSDIAAQVELAARKVTRVRQGRTVRASAAQQFPAPAVRPPSRDLGPVAVCERPAPSGRLYLTHRALLR
ncbi:MAG: hypothetical protein QM765_52745 [Myxococcales bacterium]